MCVLKDKSITNSKVLQFLSHHKALQVRLNVGGDDGTNL